MKHKFIIEDFDGSWVVKTENNDKPIAICEQESWALFIKQACEYFDRFV